MQDRYMDEVWTKFEGRSGRSIVPLFETEVRGTDMLARHGRQHVRLIAYRYGKAGPAFTNRGRFAYDTITISLARSEGGSYGSLQLKDKRASSWAHRAVWICSGTWTCEGRLPRRLNGRDEEKIKGCREQAIAERPASKQSASAVM